MRQDVDNHDVQITYLDKRTAECCVVMRRLAALRDELRGVARQLVPLLMDPKSSDAQAERVLADADQLAANLQMLVDRSRKLSPCALRQECAWDDAEWTQLQTVAIPHLAGRVATLVAVVRFTADTVSRLRDSQMGDCRPIGDDKDVARFVAELDDSRRAMLDGCRVFVDDLLYVRDRVAAGCDCSPFPHLARAGFAVMSVLQHAVFYMDGDMQREWTRFVPRLFRTAEMLAISAMVLPLPLSRDEATVASVVFSNTCSVFRLAEGGVRCCDATAMLLSAWAVVINRGDLTDAQMNDMLAQATRATQPCVDDGDMQAVLRWKIVDRMRRHFTGTLSEKQLDALNNELFWFAMGCLSGDPAVASDCLPLIWETAHIVDRFGNARDAARARRVLIDYWCEAEVVVCEKNNPLLHSMVYALQNIVFRLSTRDDGDAQLLRRLSRLPHGPVVRSLIGAFQR